VFAFLLIKILLFIRLPFYPAFQQTLSQIQGWNVTSGPFGLFSLFPTCVLYHRLLRVVLFSCFKLTQPFWATWKERKDAYIYEYTVCRE
jgi:hypothetical protein